MRLYIERSKKIAILILFVGVIGLGYQGTIKAALEYFASAGDGQVETIAPVKKLIIDDIGRIDPVSVQSYIVKQKKHRDSDSDVTYCSYVTYLNLKYLTQMQDSTFKRGDAIAIRDDLVATIPDYKAPADDTGLQNGTQFNGTGGNQTPADPIGSGDQGTGAGDQGTGGGAQDNGTGGQDNGTGNQAGSGDQNTGGDILPPDGGPTSGGDNTGGGDQGGGTPPGGDQSNTNPDQTNNSTLGLAGDVQGPETYQVVENGDMIAVEEDNGPDILTGVYQSSGENLVDILDEAFRDTNNTVFDVVTVRPPHGDAGDNEGIAHRFTVFLGTDDERYVLDPVRTGSEDPVDLTAYAEEHISKNEQMIIVDGFKAGTQERATAYDTTDLIARSPKDMLAYAIKGLITPLETGMAVIDTVRFQKSFRYESRKGKLRAKIPSGTIVKTEDKKYFDTSLFTVNQDSGDVTDLSQVVDKDFVVTDKFTFGTPNQHLIFSQPIQISLDAPGMEEGKGVDLFVQHEGQPWGTEGLTTNPNAQCDADGNLPEEDQATSTYVQSGRIVFYTCGASTFAIGIAPGNEQPNGAVTAAQEQPDGKMVIGGAFTLVGSTTRNRLARLNVDKSLDNSFNPNVNNTITAIAIQTDGSILFGGSFTIVGGITRNRIARVFSDGTLDTSFNPNLNNTVNDIKVQSNGMILIGGTFTTVSGAARNFVARLTSTGQLDTSFNPNPSALINDIGKVQPDGSIILGGNFVTISGATVNRLAKLTSTGQLVTTFNPNVNNSVLDVRMLSDGSVIFGGTFTGVGAFLRNSIAKVTSTGGLTSFDPNATGAVNNIDYDASGNVIFGGTFTAVSGFVMNRLARVDSGGVRDATFNPNSNNTISIIRVLSSGKIFVGGSFTSLGGVAQSFSAFLNNTVIDTTYNVRPSAVVTKVFVQADGKIVLGGGFTTIGGITRNRIARLDSTGALDTTFDPNASSAIYDMAQDTGGRLIIGGAFTTISGATKNFVARLTTTGQLDTSFNPNPSAYVSGVAMQTDGKILIVGAFTTISGAARNFVARLTATGQLDTAFNPNPNAAVSEVQVQSDGKIIIGGTFTTISGAAVNRIARLTTTGALDTTFNPNVNNKVNKIAIQNDGQVVFGGIFTGVGGVGRNFVARVSSTGALDTTFNPNPSNAVTAVYLLNDQSIIVGGSFTQLGGISRTELARILPDGTVDNNLDVPFLTSGTMVNSVGVDSGGNLLAGGNFTSVNGNANLTFFTRVGLGNYTYLPESFFWLDAGVGLNCFTSGCAVSGWMEKAYGQTGTQAVVGNQPSYKTIGINYNPAVKFSGFPNGTSGVATFDYINYGVVSSLSAIVNKMTIFTVQNLRIAGDHYTIGLASGAASWRYGSSFFQSSKGNSQATGDIIGAPYINAVSINDSSSSHYVNGGRIAATNLTTGNFVTGSQLWVGATESSGAYSTDGDISEIIIFRRALTGVVRNQVESYLGIKYGINLDQTTDGDGDGINGTSYRDGRGNIVWDAAVNVGYTGDTIGLGHDSVTTLDQSISSDSLILATSPDFTSANNDPSRPSLTDTAYLVGGHNGLGTGFTASYNGTANKAIPRIWKFDSTNMTTGVYIAILSGTLGLPVGGTNSGLALVISTDTTFTSGDTVVTLSLSGNAYYAFATIPDGAYLTFVDTNVAPTGSVTIGTPTGGFNLGTGQIQSVLRTLSGQSNYFTVADTKGSANGYYTTLSFSSLNGSITGTIANTSMQVKADPIALITGSANPAVYVDAGLSSYRGATGSLLFIERDIGSGGSISGTYGSKMRLKIDIPAYANIGTYTGTITYTLIEN